MKFWKEHKSLRAILMILFFAAGMTLLIVGWLMKGKMGGLGLMLIGLVLLLTTLFLYNKPFSSK